MALPHNIVLVGEAWGADEEVARKPFIGASGRLLNRLLQVAGMSRDDMLAVTNVFNLRPPGGNDVENLCCKRGELPPGYKWPPLSQGHYVRMEYLGELDRLREELTALRPNLVVALGNTPLWALTGRTGIKMYRGSIIESTLVPGLKVLPTWHPAAVMRDYRMWASCVADLQKARVESAYAEIRRPRRELLVRPTLRDLDEFYETDIVGATSLSVDIENWNQTISCIGFAPNKSRCLVVPFEDNTKPNWCYWPTHGEEVAAWRWVRKVLALPIAKIGQNFGAYDVLHLWRGYGCRVNTLLHDTMLLHHALQPEERKDLGFLASIYCADGVWKDRKARGRKSLKRDE